MHTKIEQLIADCNSECLEKQVSAILELQRLEVYSAAPILVPLLTSAESNIRGISAEALGYLGCQTPEHVGYELMKLLNDPEDLVRDEAVNSLARLDYKPALATIRSITQFDLDWVVRASAAGALGSLAEVGDMETLQVLEFALDDPVEPVRAYAACSIGIIGVPELLDTLKVYNSSEESLSVKVELLISMYRLGEQDEIYNFLKLFDDADEYFLESSLNTIKDLATRRVPEYFVANIPHIRKTLIKASERFPNQQYQTRKLLKSLEYLI
jgi:HEAT repeat protein